MLVTKYYIWSVEWIFLNKKKNNIYMIMTLGHWLNRNGRRWIEHATHWLHDDYPNHFATAAHRITITHKWIHYLRNNSFVGDGDSDNLSSRHNRFF